MCPLNYFFNSISFTNKIYFAIACHYTFNFKTETRNASLIIDFTTSI